MAAGVGMVSYSLFIFSKSSGIRNYVCVAADEMVEAADQYVGYGIICHMQHTTRHREKDHS